MSERFGDCFKLRIINDAFLRPLNGSRKDHKTIGNKLNKPFRKRNFKTK